MGVESLGISVSAFGKETWDFSSSQTYSRLSKRLGGQIVSQWPCATNRVVVALSSHVFTLMTPRKPQTASIRKSYGSRRNEFGLVLLDCTSSGCSLQNRESAVLCAPVWVAQAWFWDLIRLSIDRPLKLPQNPRLLKQPGSNIYDQNLHVWTLSSNPGQLQGFQTRWYRKFMLRRDHPPAQCMRANSGHSDLGHEIMMWMNAGSL